MPFLRPGTRLNARLASWTAAAAAGAALAAAGGLLSRWCALPGLGWGTVLAAAAAGVLAAAQVPPAGDESAPSWTAAGAAAALTVPALLRVLGLGGADRALLQDPLGGRTQAAFVLVQAALLAAASAAAFARGLRGGGRGAAAAAAAGAAAALAALRVVGPGTLLTAAGLAAFAAAAAWAAPWRPEAPRLRRRGWLLGGAAAVLLAAQGPGLLRDVWTARLHMAYPGGRFVAFADDGRRVWAGYEYSDRTAASLRDGVLQSWDPASVEAAVRAVAAQRRDAGSMLVLDSPDPRAPLRARADGLAVDASWSSTALESVVVALGGPEDWLKPLRESAPKGKADAALVFVPRPPSRGDLRRGAGPAALKALRARLTDDAAAGVLLPPDTPARDVAAAREALRAVFGAEAAADLPSGGVLVVGAPAPPVTSAPDLFSRLPLAARLAEGGASDSLAKTLSWRAPPSTK